MSPRRTGDGIRWTLNAYYNDYSDYIFESPTGDIEDDLPVFLVSQGGARQHASALKDIAPLPGRSFHLGARAEF